MNTFNEDETFGVIPKWCNFKQEKMINMAISTVETTDSWILKNAHYFSPIADWLDKKDRYLRRKSFAELAIYLYVADNLSSAKICQDFDPLMFKFVNCSEFSGLIKRHPKQLLLYGAAVNYVKHKKMLNRQAESAVDAVLKRRAVWAVERVPHRILDLWNFLAVYGGKTQDLNPEIILGGFMHILFA